MAHVWSFRVHDQPELGALGPVWDRLSHEGADDGVVMLTRAWLEAWRAVYEPERLVGLVVEDGGRPIGAALVEASRTGRWRLAGAPVTTVRRPLCLPGAEEETWSALRGWMRRWSRHFAELEVEAADPGVVRAPFARQFEGVGFVLPLAADVDAVLARRSRNSRQQLRRKLRRFEAAGGVLRHADPHDHPAALRRLVELHGRRAATLGERHPSVDDRLVRLLVRYAERRPGALTVTEAVHDDAVVASVVRVDHGRTGLLLQLGLEPGASDLAPGVCAVLHSVADACSRGLTTFDLGPGDFRYKRDLGGEPSPHWRLVAPSVSLPGAAVWALRGTREAARRLTRGRGRARG